MTAARLFPFGTIRDVRYVRAGLISALRDIRASINAKTRAADLIEHHSWMLVDCKYVLSRGQAARLNRVVSHWGTK